MHEPPTTDELHFAIDTLIDHIVERVSSRVIDSLSSQLSETITPRSTDNKQLYRENEVAAMLGIKPRTLQNWRQRGVIKATTNVRPVLYDQAAIDNVKQFIIRTGQEPDVRQLERGED